MESVSRMFVSEEDDSLDFHWGRDPDIWWYTCNAREVPWLEEGMGDGRNPCAQGDEGGHRQKCLGPCVNLEKVRGC